MELQQIIDIVRDVSRLTDSQLYNIKVTEKDGPANIVTSADLAVQQALIARLSSLLPGSHFLCEEEHLDNPKVIDDAPLWIIDPIDGTANYARGINDCAISVAYSEGGQVEMGVVYLPRTGECFSAQRRRGAWLNGEAIHVSERSFKESILCTAMCVYHKENAPICAGIIMETYLQANDFRRFGAAAPELCYLAAGRVELFFEYMLSPWDYAAAQLVLTEAGGIVSDLEGQALNPTRPSGILAANNAENHARLVEIAAKNLKPYARY